MIVLNRYEQAFVHAVRRTGGNNLYRNLVIQGPRTDINRTDMWMQLPEDTVSARMIIEVHFMTRSNSVWMTIRIAVPTFGENLMLNTVLSMKVHRRRMYVNNSKNEKEICGQGNTSRIGGI